LCTRFAHTIQVQETVKDVAKQIRQNSDDNQSLSRSPTLTNVQSTTVSHYPITAPPACVGDAGTLCTGVDEYDDSGVPGAVEAACDTDTDGSPCQCIDMDGEVGSMMSVYRSS